MIALPEVVRSFLEPMRESRRNLFVPKILPVSY